MPNTNACHELFLKRQELLRNQNKTNEQINKLKNIQEEILERRKVLKEIIRDPGFDPETRKEAVELWQDLHGHRGQYGEKKLARSKKGMSDEEYDRARKEISDNLEDLQTSGFTDEAIKAGGKGKKFRVNIPERQPVNYRQMLRNNPAEFVRDWADLTTALQRASFKVFPDEWDFLAKDSKAKAEEIYDAMDGAWSIDQIMEQMASDADAFNGLVEKTYVMRWLSEETKSAYLEVLKEVASFMDLHSGSSAGVPKELAERVINNGKLALLGERHYDYIRNIWGRMGLAQQGRMRGKGLEWLTDEVANELNKEISTSATKINSIKKVQEIGVEDINEESSIGRVFNAIDQYQSNPKEAMKQLELELGSVMIQGADPNKRMDPKVFKDRQARWTNNFVKDHQLWNERTPALNVASNFNMALWGSTRRYFQNVSFLRRQKQWVRGQYTGLGDSWTRPFIDAWEAQWEGYRAAFKAMRVSGKEVFLDSFQNKSNFYGGSVDTYGMDHEKTEELLARLKLMMEWGPGISKNASGRSLMKFSPESWRRWMHASSRLWLWEKTKNPYFLRPGMTLLAATDNVSGYAYHSYHLRTQLEMRARREGVQLGLVNDDGSLSRKKMRDWVDKKFNESFYSMQVTEKDIKAYRKEKGINSAAMPDTEVADLIREEKVAVTYGAPNYSSEESLAAGHFSDEMRFQKKPGRKNTGRGLFSAIKTLKSDHYIADILFPYLQSPFMGTSMDFGATGVGPVKDLILHYSQGRDVEDPTYRLSEEQMDKVKANFGMTALLYTTWIFLDSAGLIVGNGPVDPGEREEWLTRNLSEGKRANTIAGIPMVGGLPIISTFFLFTDVRENMERVVVEEGEAQEVANAMFSVLAGHLQRTTAVGDVQKLMEIVYGDEYGVRRPMAAATYLGSSQLPGIGLTRTAERVTGSRASQQYMPRDWTKEEMEIFNPSVLETAQRKLMGAAGQISGLSGGAGINVYKDYDWLGTKIRLPWGFMAARYIKHRFSPILHPKDKAYEELDRLNLLRKPKALITRTLHGIPMSSRLQEEYNNTMGTVRGNGNMYADLRQSQDYEGEKLTVGNTTIDVAAALTPIVEGRTMLEAVRALMKEPQYQEFSSQTKKEFSKKFWFFGENHTMNDEEVRETMAWKLMKSLKSYYELRTLQEIKRSDSDAAALWRERAAILQAYEDAKTNDQVKQSAEDAVGLGNLIQNTSQ